MNVTSLPAGGANVRVYKTTANGSAFLASPVALTLGSNTITVGAVGFDRAVKFQFSDGAVDFDALSLNGVNSTCVGSTPAIPGCTDPTAYNYNSAANTDDGSCVAVVNGCTDPTAYNYNSAANTDDGSCMSVVSGCTDSLANNYNASANTDDGSCLYGCPSSVSVSFPYSGIGLTNCGSGFTVNNPASSYDGSSWSDGEDGVYDFTATTSGTI
jgi:hypothetical protein